MKPIGLSYLVSAGATLRQQVDALQTQYTAIGDQLENEQDNINKASNALTSTDFFTLAVADRPS